MDFLALKCIYMLKQGGSVEISNFEDSIENPKRILNCFIYFRNAFLFSFIFSARFVSKGVFVWGMCGGDVCCIGILLIFDETFGKKIFSRFFVCFHHYD